MKLDEMSSTYDEIREKRKGSLKRQRDALLHHMRVLLGKPDQNEDKIDIVRKKVWEIEDEIEQSDLD